MSFLTRVLDDFAAKVPQVQWAQIQKDSDCKYDGLGQMLGRWQNPREADPMTRVQVSFLLLCFRFLFFLEKSVVKETTAKTSQCVRRIGRKSWPLFPRQLVLADSSSQEIPVC